MSIFHGNQQVPAFERQAWMQDAACKGMDPNLFIPDRGSAGCNADVMAAKAVCRECPVRQECLEYGLMEKQGVWGGLSERERRILRRRRRLGEAA